MVYRSYCFVSMVALQAKSCEVELAWPKRCIEGVIAELDCYKLSQVMRNLISNALKFTPKGGKVRVTAEVLQAGAPPPRARSMSNIITHESEEANFLRLSKTSPSAARPYKNSGAGSSGVNSADEHLDLFARSHSSDETPPQPSFAGYSPLRSQVSGAVASVLFPAGVDVSPTPTLEVIKELHSRNNSGIDLECGNGNGNAAVQCPDSPSVIGDTEKIGAFTTFKASTYETPTGKTAKIEAPDKNGEVRSSPEASSSPADSLDACPGAQNEITFAQAAANSSNMFRNLFSMLTTSAPLKAKTDPVNAQVFPTVTMVRISVTDSGAGISLVRLMTLFFLVSYM
jgi:hypothetical protein